jgi:hypothetical protein
VKRKKSDQAQYVGIFWLVNGKMVIDSTPLSEAEPYGDHRDHPRSHIDHLRLAQLPSRLAAPRIGTLAQSLDKERHEPFV